jgi:hypothetical protein
LTKRTARADLGPVLLVATEIAAHRVPPAALAPLFLLDEKAKTCQQRRVWAGWSAEKRRARGRARSAHQQLTCRRLFERSERSERSEFGDGPRDRRREVCAQRRPLQRSA